MKYLSLFCIVIFCMTLFTGIHAEKTLYTYPIPEKEYCPFLINEGDDSQAVLITLDLSGIAYGHELLWKANTTGTNYEESSVVYSNGMAYIGSCSTHGDGHDSVFAVDTTNGEIVWSVPIGPGYVGPVIDNDRLYIGTSSHGYDPTNEYFYCINRTDGTILWRRNIYGGIPESIQYDAEKIYFTSDKIYALDKQDGSIVWTYQMESFSVTKPILKDNAFYTATSGGMMYKINATDGQRIWMVRLSGFSWDNSITADGQGRIFLALYEDRTMNAYDEETGELLWSYRLHDRSLSFNAYHDHVVFISDLSGYVYAFNASTGDLIWENKIGNTFDISSPSLSGGLVLIGTRDFEEGAFYALNETTGDILWKYRIGSSVTAPPTLVDGMLLCGTDNWHMYAFDFGVGGGDWLLSRYDASNTAYSPMGISTWCSVSATCLSHDRIATCHVENTYDHDINDINLTLPGNAKGNWFDASGSLVQLESSYYIIDSIPHHATINLTISLDQDYAPSTPTLSGPTLGKTGKECSYSASSTDYDNEDIFYLFDWDDGTEESWIGPYASGEECIASHTWDTNGAYTLRVKAKDINGYESDWSDPLLVSMPKQKALGLFHQFIEWYHSLLLGGFFQTLFPFT